MDGLGIVILFTVVFGGIYLGIHYLVAGAVHKGTDAIENAMKRKRNAANGGTTENLADRFQH